MSRIKSQRGMLKLNWKWRITGLAMNRRRTRHGQTQENACRSNQSQPRRSQSHADLLNCRPNQRRRKAAYSLNAVLGRFLRFDQLFELIASFFALTAVMRTLRELFRFAFSLSAL